MERTLTVDEHYHGKYVALKGLDDATIVGTGENPDEALRDAKKKNFLKPYIVYIPGKGTVTPHRCS